MNEETKMAKDAQTEVAALSDADLEAVSGGATVPVKKKPAPKGNGTGAETHNPGLKNQSSPLR